MTNDIEQEIDALFELRPDAFTKARNELAARLTGERAAEVKRLRRPTVAAWAVNLLVRREEDRMRELAPMGDRLRAAQRAVLSGKQGGELREVGEERRALIRALTERADALLRAEGTRSPSSMDDVAATLEAASTDEASARVVLSGRLQRPSPRPAGFGDLSGLQVVAGQGKSRTPSSQAEGRVERERTRRGLREAEETERRARSQAERLRREIEELQQRIGERKERLRAAEAELRGAALRARRARSELE